MKIPFDAVVDDLNKIQQLDGDIETLERLCEHFKIVRRNYIANVHDCGANETEWERVTRAAALRGVTL
jgi:hypothetical protein